MWIQHVYMWSLDVKPVIDLIYWFCSLQGAPVDQWHATASCQASPPCRDVVPCLPSFPTCIQVNAFSMHFFSIKWKPSIYFHASATASKSQNQSVKTRKTSTAWVKWMCLSLNDSPAWVLKWMCLGPPAAMTGAWGPPAPFTGRPSSMSTVPVRAPRRKRASRPREKARPGVKSTRNPCVSICKGTCPSLSQNDCFTSNLPLRLAVFEVQSPSLHCLCFG